MQQLSVHVVDLLLGLFCFFCVCTVLTTFCYHLGGSSLIDKGKYDFLS